MTQSASETSTHPPTAPLIAVHTVSFTEALRYWLTLGFINFGGPAGQIALMHRDLVERRAGFLTNVSSMPSTIASCFLAPKLSNSPFTLAGSYMGRVGDRCWSAFRPAVDICAPAALLYLCNVWSAFSCGTLAGVKPVVVAVVIEAIVRIGRRALKRPEHFVIAVAGFILIYFLRVPFPVIVLGLELLDCS